MVGATMLSGELEEMYDRSIKEIEDINKMSPIKFSIDLPSKEEYINNYKKMLGIREWDEPILINPVWGDYIIIKN